MQTELRIDKWLWAVRIYKTRSIATDECNKGRIIVNNIEAKPSRMVKVNDTIKVRKPPIDHIYKVIGITQNRIGAKLTVNFYEDLTPTDIIEQHKMNQKTSFVIHERGLGRPTKKNRRDISDFRNNLHDNEQ